MRAGALLKAVVLDRHAVSTSQPIGLRGINPVPTSPRGIGSLAWLLLPCLASGCASLLPHGSTRTASPFASFDEARAAMERVVPYRTRTSELRELGFDLHDSANMREVPYPEVVARIAPNPSIPLELLDAGIRDCIVARLACRAYEFKLGELTRQRTGAFLLDFLNFRRTTVVTGWHFEGLLVVRDDLVLFRNHGGEPQVQRTEQQSNPLGPLQPAGEASGGLLLR